MKIVDLATFRNTRRILPPGRFSALEPGQPVRRNGLSGKVASFERTFRGSDLLMVDWENGRSAMSLHTNLEVVPRKGKASA